MRDLPPYGVYCCPPIAMTSRDNLVPSTWMIRKWCGFSAAVVGILKQTGVPFESYNILADQELREGLKVYSSWPTYPQLYVDGKLIGGADIVRDLHAKGELQQILTAQH